MIILLTICLACDGLSLDLAAIAANSTSFFNVSILELRDFIVFMCNRIKNIYNVNKGKLQRVC